MSVSVEAYEIICGITYSPILSISIHFLVTVLYELSHNAVPERSDA